MFELFTNWISVHINSIEACINSISEFTWEAQKLNNCVH